MKTANTKYRKGHVICLNLYDIVVIVVIALTILLAAGVWIWYGYKDAQIEKELLRLK